MNFSICALYNVLKKNFKNLKKEITFIHYLVQVPKYTNMENEGQRKKFNFSMGKKLF